MILVRDIFRLKYGMARPARALMQEAKKFMGDDMIKRSRVMFDLVGPAYTMVLEMTYENLADFEKQMSSTDNKDEWAAWYQKFLPNIDSGYREIFTIEP